MANLSDAKWFKNSHSGGSSDCIEVPLLPNSIVGVRDSKTLSGPTLVFPPAEWSTDLTSATTRGEFDR
ncbi:DUF397 domain-containing protein [Nocardia sp. NPDC051990]|uniref:DUF397 domain-containing protein n=1 Tax=Nocardia sp. NPDC051990 TaxID=3155285 RepID=UPI0034467B57